MDTARQNEYPSIPPQMGLMDTCSPPSAEAGLKKMDLRFLEKKTGIRVYP
jgi:hypothetical protein